MLGVKNVGVERSHVLPYVEQICKAIDCSLTLRQNDEYELGHTVVKVRCQKWSDGSLIC